MASPDKIKVGAYLTASENEALKRVADSLGVSASKAVAMAIKSLDEKLSKGVKVSLPISVSTGDKVEPSPDIQALVNESVKDAIAELSIPIDSLINKDELGSVIADLRKEFGWIDETIKQLQSENEQLKKDEPIG